MTLLEMMVVVGLLVLIMTILVEIFRSATGAITTQRTYAALDQELRRFDTTLRHDLAGATAKLSLVPSPRLSHDEDWPAKPGDQRGYLCYSEGAFADAQGEDTDDTIAFTAKAPQGLPFTGYITVPVVGTPPANPVFHRVQITSNNAEIIYFLRNGNLYRRVFLIVPATQMSSVWNAAYATAMTNIGGVFGPTNLVESAQLYGQSVSWFGLNDVSCRPAPTIMTGGVPNATMPLLNSLGDLTNRENRAFNPRFSNDYANNTSGAAGADGIPDDLNGDGISDDQPTLYPAMVGLYTMKSDGSNFIPAILGSSQTAAFPFVYPNGYSVADTPLAAGRLHSQWANVTPSSNPKNLPTPIINHAPLDMGDPYGPPDYAPISQTWWGFPTKKETLSSKWTDPVWRMNANGGVQALPLQSATTTATAALPPMTEAARGPGRAQPYNDGAGSVTFYPGGAINAANLEVYQALVEEDLILSNVRSFDIKALDPTIQQYVDLGWWSQSGVRVYGYSVADVTAFNNIKLGDPVDSSRLIPDPTVGTPFAVAIDLDGDNRYDTKCESLFSLGHEGRMPALTVDNRSDPQFPGLNPNIGDAGTNAATVRLRRTWDSWSRDYTNVPWQTIDPSHSVTNNLPPPYPSYPAPYPVSLTGIQIQVRVVDPTNQRIKLHTIRQDFSNNQN